MKLTIYLATDDVHDFEEMLRKSYLEGDESYIALDRKGPEAPYEACAYIQREKSAAPKWVDFVANGFELDAGAIANTYNSVVILLKAKGRVFAIPFGNGYHAINRAKIERDFGLKTTLNTLGEEGVQTVYTRNLDVLTRQQRTRMNRPTDIRSFDINEYVDWIRSIEGKPVGTADDQEADLPGVRNLSGSESLRVGCSWKLEDLADHCSRLLNTYRSEAYKEHFAFIDHFRPLKKDDPLVTELDQQLSAMLHGKNQDDIALAVPDFHLDYSRIETFKVYRGRKNREMPELSLKMVFELWDELEDGDRDPEKVNIIILGQDGDPISPKRSLRDYLVAEVKLDDRTFVLSMSQWFEVAAAFLDEVKEKLGELDDVTGDLQMPDIYDGEHEGDYNARVAGVKEWLLMDKENITFESHLEKVEVCDLLTPGHRFICVKKMTSSATLSHLFAQGSVSAALMKEQDYLDEINRLINEGDFGAEELTLDNLADATIVFAMPTTKVGDVRDCIFFFSRINLLAHVDVIRRVGLNAAICKVEYGPAPSAEGDK